MKKLGLVCAVALMLGASQMGTAPDADAQIHIEVFNVDILEAKIKKELDGNAVGYSYAIYEYGTLRRSGGGGWAVLNKVKHSANQRQATMSMSKTITAAAVMKAIEEVRAVEQAEGVPASQQLSIDTKISKYLPYNWKRGPHVDQITVRDLLQHTSGLRAATGDPDTYAGLEQTIANGSTDANFHKGFYANANFCLFRVLLPFMVQPKGYFIEPLKDGTVDAKTAAIYSSWIRQHVLAPAGIASDVTTEPSGPLPYTRYYDVNNTSSVFDYTLGGAGTLRAGAGYWYMSAVEFGRFIGALRGGKIITPASYQTMITAKPADPDPVQQGGDRLGMWESQTPHGAAFDHNGGYVNQEGDWMSFANGFHVVILLNSLNKTGKAPENVVRDSFNGSW